MLAFPMTFADHSFVFSASRHISSPTAPTLRINRAGVDGLVEELDTNFINRAVE
jgi:hypothetical protein